MIIVPPPWNKLFPNTLGMIRVKTPLFFSLLGGETPFSLDLGPKGCSNIKRSLEKPSDKCQGTPIIQNLFYGM